MTTLELERLARDLVPPRGATAAVMSIVHEPGGRLQNGYPSGIGGKTSYAPAWLIDGLTKSKPIALFDRQADALRLVGLINGTEVSASRARPDATTPEARTRAVDLPTGLEASTGIGVSLLGAGGHDELQSSSVAMPEPARTCERCGRPLPIGSRSQRRTCSGACRQALANAHRDTSLGGSGDLTVSEGSTEL